MAEFDLASARAMLARTPATLRTMLEDVPAEWVEEADREGAWRAFDIVGHLIHGDLEDWIPRAHVIVERGESEPLPPYDRGGHERALQGKTLSQALHAFADIRRQSLTALDALHLDGETLSRTGMHPAFGAVTLRQLLATWTAHDLSHIGQIADSMARRYRDEVGPWRRFLPVLDRPEEDSG